METVKEKDLERHVVLKAYFRRLDFRKEMTKDYIKW